MSKSWTWRVVGFVAGILAMIALVTWSTKTSWSLLGNLEERFATVEQASFYYADRLQQTMLRLNNLMLRFQTRQNPADWREFQQNSQFLDNWIKAKSRSEEERKIQRELDAIYDEFCTTAERIHTKLTEGGPQDIAEENKRFEAQSQRMSAKISELSKAHRQAQQLLLANFNSSLSKLQIVLVAALIMMVAGGTGLAMVVYRDLIAPLRLQLIESRVLLERQEKLASLGVLAAGVAHEIRNPLTAIKARLFTLRKGLKSNTRELADADVIDQEINRLERIVKDFLMFARPSEPAFAIIPAIEPLREIESLMRPQLEKAGVQITIETSPPATIKIDPQQIKQVLMNLIQNAAEAVGEKGRIILRVRKVQATLAGKPQEAAALEVEDNGKGISEEAQKRLFDPFFSTKEGGSGLGLSIAARLVENQGGLLHFQTQVNRGTTFAIILPQISSS